MFQSEDAKQQSVISIIGKIMYIFKNVSLHFRVLLSVVNLLVRGDDITVYLVNVFFSWLCKRTPHFGNVYQRFGFMSKLRRIFMFEENTSNCHPPFLVSTRDHRD